MSHEEEMRQRAENNSEMLDRLDESGRVIGQVRRGDVHGNPALRHPSVHLFVVNSLGQYYLQRRSPYKKVQPNKWDTSVGGHIPAGESYEQGALRELAEELGVVLADNSRLKRHHDFVWSTDFETEHTRTFILEYEGPFRVDPAEVAEGRFWSKDELRSAVGKDMLTPNLELELKFLGII
jgi:isopentenyldiphosphate isomerase